MDDEIVDLVNDQDVVIGTVNREDFYAIPEGDEPGYIRAVALLIQNDDGKLWIPTRAVHKKRLPNGLDYSAEGHLGVGESYIAAILRETKEELNLALEAEQLKFVAKIPPAHGRPYYRELYLFHSNVTPNYNHEDIAKGEWLAPNEVLKKLASGTAGKTSLAEVMHMLKNNHKRS